MKEGETRNNLDEFRIVKRDFNHGDLSVNDREKDGMSWGLNMGLGSGLGCITNDMK